MPSASRQANDAAPQRDGAERCPASLSSLLALLWPHTSVLAQALVGMLGVALGSAAYAFLVGPLFALLFGAESLASTGTRGLARLPLPFEAAYALDLWLPLLIVAVAVLKGGAHFLQQLALAKLAQRIGVELRQRAFERLLDSPQGGELRAGVATRLLADVDAVHTGLVDAFAAVLRDGTTVLLLVLLCFGLDPLLAAVALVGLPLALWPIARFGRQLRGQARSANGAAGALVATATELLAFAPHLRSSAAQRGQCQRFDGVAGALAAARVRAAGSKALSHPVMELFGVLSLLAVVFLALARVRLGVLDAAAVVSFLAAVLMLYEPLKALSRAWASVQEARAGHERLAPWLVPPAPWGTDEAGPLVEGVRIEASANPDVEPPSPPEWAPLELAARSTTLVSGPSGCGKTTLLRHLAGLCRQAPRHVFWNGRPIDDFSRDSIARRVGYLDQDALCMAASVRHNLDPGGAATEASLWRALEHADAATWVRERGGLDFVVAEGGANISGGERRRLALARALLSESDLLLLDEPTDGLDAVTEARLLEVLAREHGQRTIVLVTHHPERVPWADRRLEVRLASWEEHSLDDTCQPEAPQLVASSGSCP